MKRLLSLALSIALMVSLLLVPAEAATKQYTDDWLYWSQGASGIGGKMNKSGCRVVSQAKLLMETGVASGDFDPDIYGEWARQRGYFGYTGSQYTLANKVGENASGTTTMGTAPVAYAKAQGKELTYHGERSLKSKKKDQITQIMGWLKDGYYVIIGSSAHHVYVARDKSLEANTVILSNSGSKYSTKVKCEKWCVQQYKNRDAKFVYARLYTVPDAAPKELCTQHVQGEWLYFWDKHPHYDTYRCAVCGETYTEMASSNYYAKCEICNLPAEEPVPSSLPLSSVPSSNLTETVPVSGGVYTLTPKCASNMKLDVAGGDTKARANIQISTSNGTLAQQFKFTAAGDGWYTIKAMVSGRVLDLNGGGTSSGTNVHQYTPNGTDAQKWRVEDAGDGYVYIIPCLNTDLCLDVDNGKTSAGTNVQVWKANGTDAQKWKLTAVTSVVSAPTVEPCVEHTKGEWLWCATAHPHYNTFRCTVCGEAFDDGSASEVAKCELCYPE